MSLLFGESVSIVHLLSKLEGGLRTKPFRREEEGYGEMRPAEKMNERVFPKRAGLALERGRKGTPSPLFKVKAIRGGWTDRPKGED